MELQGGGTRAALYFTGWHAASDRSPCSALYCHLRALLQVAAVEASGRLAPGMTFSSRGGGGGAGGEKV